MPSGESALISALPTAGSALTLPASPAPLTPSGLVSVGTGLLSQWIAEKLSAHCVIHERAGQELPRTGVEADIPHQHLADSDL